MNVIILGAPGVGKGTQAQLLVDREKFVQLSTGDILRSEQANGTELGLAAKLYMERGELVPDTVILNMVALRMETGKSYLFDGFPRTIAQAEGFETILSGRGMKIDRVISLEVPFDEIVKRLSSRRVALKSGRVYNLMSNPPKVEGICDVSGEPLIHRADDQPEAIQVRLQEYEKKTAPLKQYYERKIGVSIVDANGEVEAVYRRVKATLA
ncbi:MAG: adenylate kinase [bacterium]|nr:adenylate kinase [bacterium]